jgi:hypothetical protein
MVGKLEPTMRVAEEIRRSGYFWLPGKDEYKAPGILIVSDGAKISLEIIGSFAGPTGSISDLKDEMIIGRVIGQVEKSGLVTLENCFFTTKRFSFGGISKSQINVGWALLGVAFDPDEIILFDGLTVSIEGLDEWIGLSGIETHIDQDLKSFTLHYAKPASETLIKTDDMTVSFDFGYNIPSGTPAIEAKVRQNAFFKIQTEELKTPKYFINMVNRLRDFLSLAVDQTVSIKEVSATNSNIIEKFDDIGSKVVRMEIYFPAINHSDIEPKIAPHKMLFRYQDIGEQPEKVLASWLALYDTIEPVMNLYFASKAGAQKFLDGRFLALAQAMETLHRRTSTETAMQQDQFEQLVAMIVKGCPDEHKEWLQQRLYYGNEISLARRIARLFEPFTELFGDNAERKKIKRMITDTRNYLTHYDEKLSDKAAKGRNLWVLCQKMEALLQLHFLKTLSFTNQQISSVGTGSQALAGKLGLKFEKN